MGGIFSGWHHPFKTLKEYRQKRMWGPYWSYRLAFSLFLLYLIVLFAMTIVHGLKKAPVILIFSAFLAVVIAYLGKGLWEDFKDKRHEDSTRRQIRG